MRFIEKTYSCFNRWDFNSGQYSLYLQHLINLVDAGSRKKIHFTQTITSSQDPGQGHENHQLALILSPNEGTLYDGSMTFTSSESCSDRSFT